MSNITNLLSQVQVIVSSYSRISKMSGQNFNIFSLLRKENDEVRLHSKFIAELLNPNGSHHQGSLFLNAFLEILNISDFCSEEAKVYVEYYTGVINSNKDLGGNIDILIQSKDDHLIKIENKINAGEQKNQLLRYHNFKNKGHLFFLTLNGHKSIDDDYLNGKNIEYQQISYKNDITSWLETCIEKCATIPILRESIIQYLNLVKKITNQIINQKMSKEIVKQITSSKDSFEAYLAIRKTENDNQIYFDIVKTHLIPFFENFAVQNNLELSNLHSSLIEERKQYNGFSFKSQIMTKYGISITLQFAKSLNRDLYYGLSFLNESPVEIDIYKLLTMESKNVMDNPKILNNWWLCYVFLKEYNDLNNIDTLYDVAYGNFKSHITSKLDALLNMTYSVINNYEKK